MRYFAEPEGTPAMAEKDALALWRRARDGEMRDRLAENFQPMIAAEAELAAGGAGAAEFVRRGNLGLLRAFCCYRPESSTGFYEYCRRRVRETMRDAAAGGEKGIGSAAEVARLWGELSREFSALDFGAVKMRVPARRREPFHAASAPSASSAH